MSLEVQFVTMGYMFGSGLILGILYDIYRVLSLRLRLPRWIIPLIDIIYWVVATVIVFCLLYYSNLGQVRVFIFVAMLLGVTFYFVLLSKGVRKVLHRIADILIWLGKVLVRIIDVLVIRPSLWLYRVLGWIIRLIFKVFVFLGKLMLQLLYPLRLLGRLLKLGKLLSWLKRYF